MSRGERSFHRPCTKSETDRAPCDIAISMQSIYYKIKSIFIVYSPIEECNIGIAVNKC